MRPVSHPPPSGGAARGRVSAADGALTPRRAAIATVVGYVLGWGVPLATFKAVPSLLDLHDAARTSQNILAHPRWLVAATFAMLLNFVGDVVAAWGLYHLLRPAGAALSALAALLRIVFATMGLAATAHLATASRLLANPAHLEALGRGQLDAQVQISLVSFNVQNAFSLIVFGVHLVLLGWLAYRSRSVPRWLGVVLALDGAAWIAIESGPYVLPGVDLGVLWIATGGELLFLAWLIGWGTRVTEAAARRDA